MSGTLARKFGLHGEVSVFAYLDEPCLTAGQGVAVVAGIEGGRKVYLHGTALAECR
jgi:ribosomal 30S subunit maturation factor RimM